MVVDIIVAASYIVLKLVWWSNTSLANVRRLVTKEGTSLRPIYCCMNISLFASVNSRWARTRTSNFHFHFHFHFRMCFTIPLSLF